MSLISQPQYLISHHQFPMQTDVHTRMRWD